MIPSPGTGELVEWAERPWAASKRMMHLAAVLGRVAAALVAGISGAVEVEEVWTIRAARLRERPTHHRRRRTHRHPFQMMVSLRC